MKMKTFTALLLLLLPLQAIVAAEDAVPVSVAREEVSTAEILQDVMALNEALPHYSFPGRAVKPGEEPLLAELKDAAARIRPMVVRLRALPAARVKEACLLAHRILCQQQYLYGVYLGEWGWEFEAPDNAGLDAVEILFEEVLQLTGSKEQITPQALAVLQEFVEACGGEETMRHVMAWQKEAVADAGPECEQDSLAALAFFKDFCAAVSTENEAQSLLLLARLRGDLQRLCRDNEHELLRVNALVPTFRAALIDLWETDYDPPKPYPNPVMPLTCRTEARMQALQPFFEQLPALSTLALKTAEWQEVRPAAPQPDYHAPTEYGEVLGIEVFLQENGAPRLLLEGEERTLEDLRTYSLENYDAPDLFVRFVLEKYEDIASPEVQDLMRFCEECGVSNFLLAVRPKNPLATDALGKPLYFVDVVCRLSHPLALQTWVEFYAAEAADLVDATHPGYSPLIRVKTPQGKLLEYRSQNVPPSVLTVDEPWSPDGEYLLLPVGLHAGFLLVRVYDLDKPDFDWRQATPVNARAEWQSAPLYTSPRWEMDDDEEEEASGLKIRFGTGLSGESKWHCYDVATGTMSTEVVRATGK